jgi:hypothetical protein
MRTLAIDPLQITVTNAFCTESSLVIELCQHQQIITPLWHYPRLYHATPEQRAQIEIQPLGIHWPLVDEDLSLTGILEGRKAPGAVAP